VPFALGVTQAALRQLGLQQWSAPTQQVDPHAVSKTQG